GLHPFAQLPLVVQQLGDVGLGVLVVGAPEERVEWADLDADAAVHAERVVDVEAVEDADRALAAALTTRRSLLLVALDVDAPVGAGASTQHADGAVLLLQCDDAAGAGRRARALGGILHRDRRLQHRLERDAETADHTGDLALLHQIATFTLVSLTAGRDTRPAAVRSARSSRANEFRVAIRWRP